MIVMKSEYYRPACASCTMQQARAIIIILCANVHTARAKAKYAHNHVTAESAQPRNRSKCCGWGLGTRLHCSSLVVPCVVVLVSSFPSCPGCKRCRPAQYTTTGWHYIYGIDHIRYMFTTRISGSKRFFHVV